MSMSSKQIRERDLVDALLQANETKLTKALDDALENVSQIEWSDDEPDVIKAIVFNQLFTDDAATALTVLDKLLPFVTSCTMDRMDALLKKQSVVARLQKCVDRHNELNSDRKIDLITSIEQLEPALRNSATSLPVYVVSLTQTLGRPKVTTETQKQ